MSKKDIYKLNSFSWIKIVLMFVVLWGPLYFISQTLHIIPLFKEVLYLFFLVEIIFLLPAIVIRYNPKLLTSHKKYIDFNKYSIISIFLFELWVLSYMMRLKDINRYGVLELGLFLVIVSINHFIFLQFQNKLVKKCSVCVYQYTSFNTIDTFFSNASISTFFITIIFSFYKNDFLSEVIQLIAFFVYISLIIFTNKICFSLFYSPENRKNLNVNDIKEYSIL